MALEFIANTRVAICPVRLVFIIGGELDTGKFSRPQVQFPGEH